MIEISGLNGRILMVSSERSWRGGEVQVYLLMKGLREKGIDSSLAAPSGSAIALCAAAEKFEVFQAPFVGDLDIMSILRLRSIVKKRSFSIIHTHSAHAHGAALLSIKGLRKRPSLVITRRVSFETGKTLFSRIKYKHGADLYIAISAGVKESLVKAGIKRELIQVIPSGMDTARVDGLRKKDRILKEFSIPENARLVGTIGALTANKAQDDLLKAAAGVLRVFSNTRFIITGEGERYDMLKSLAQNLGIEDKVIFTGFRADAMDILASLDCFVISSIHEGLCTSIMDAQAAGIPVVATRTGGIPDLIADGETGLLVPPGKPEELAQGICSLLGDAVFSKRCSDAARKKIAAYDYRLMVDRTMDAYAGINR